MSWTRVCDKPVRLESFDLWPEGRAFGHRYMENTGIDGVDPGDDISPSRAATCLWKKVRVLVGEHASMLCSRARANRDSACLRPWHQSTMRWAAEARWCGAAAREAGAKQRGGCEAKHAGRARERVREAGWHAR